MKRDQSEREREREREVGRGEQQIRICGFVFSARCVLMTATAAEMATLERDRKDLREQRTAGRTGERRGGRGIRDQGVWWPLWD